ncbi:hypothetical protein AHF37_11746 [Paragonimus kellicotti]|nr:hypothetical protein AHF37_11746 [Paragonimus kellicotti]
MVSSEQHQLLRPECQHRLQITISVPLFQMLTFVQATSVIMGMKSALTPTNYIRWRRKLSTWLDINSLQERYIKKHEIQYRLVPADFQPQR